MKWFALVIFIFFPSYTIACGTVSQRMYFYWYLDTVEKKETFLKESSCFQPINYSPLDTDLLLAKILNDAIDLDVKSEVINKIIDSYNCMYGAYYSKEYVPISRYIAKNGLDSVCNEKRFESSFVVVADGGVNLRSEPSKSGQKVGTIAEGVLVRVKRIEEQWAFLESYSGEGYVYFPLLKSLKKK